MTELVDGRLVDGRLVPVGDTELFVTAGTGTGMPVLVMHGGLGIDHSCLRPWLDGLGDVAELVFYDHRGNGRSSRAPLDGVDHATWVADAEALREHLGHEQLVVLGHSYGGFLALRYALAHPDRVRGLVLVSTAATMRHWERVHEALAAREATPAQLRAFEDRPFVDDEDMGATLAALLPLYFRRPRLDVLAAIGRTTRFSAAASAAGGRCLADYDVRADLERLDVPALVLAGAHDLFMPADVTAEPLAAALPAAELVVFEDSGHFPFIEEHDAFLRVVRRWLASLEQRS